MLSLAYQLLCEGGLPPPLDFLSTAVSCTVGGCPGAFAGLLFCKNDLLSNIDCAAGLIMECTGPYSKAAQIGVKMALCAATIADTAAGGDRRRSLESLGGTVPATGLSQDSGLDRAILGRTTLPLTAKDRLRKRREFEEEVAAQLFHASSKRVANMVLLMEAVFGQGNETMASAYSPSFQRNAFLPAILQGGPMGELLTTEELDTILAANLTTVSPPTVLNFAMRWNNTVSAWSNGCAWR